MKVKVYINDEKHWMQPKTNWQRFVIEEPIHTISVDKNFYVAVFMPTEIKQGPEE